MATNSCPPNFTLADNSYISSKIPMITMIIAPSVIDNILCSYKPPTTNPTATPINIANPPRRGIIFWCTLRAFGLSVAPILKANLITKGVTTSTVMKDAKMA
ncbi:Uncharacterised protein [Streptococcus pneumoniae]|nr:Uncharacterised protein [Streptococcus pneumoniae]CJI73470.1 Uncharacterised protein [Streptococcus pneumoniae]CKF86990.1 Uncharacterised protein [Streptococcus pneumoniae]CKH11066.1 Uncharacterised protein [Streptococcus pneumoniae]